MQDCRKAGALRYQDATVWVVTGTKTESGAGTLLLSAYTDRVPWTGSKIRDARAHKGWTQRELANQLGASVRSVAAWERDEASPQTHWIGKLDATLGTTTVDEPVETSPAPITGRPSPGADDQTWITWALGHASHLELVAEVAARLTQARPRISEQQPTGAPPERYRWRTEDAPSAKRAPGLDTRVEPGHEQG